MENNSLQLDVLLKDLAVPKASIFKGVSITGITTDPEACRPGYLYLADECETVDSKRYGVRLDGRDYIETALKNGALAVLTTEGTKLPEGYADKVALIESAQPLSLLGPLSSRFYARQNPRHIALVTGTNGKTSTVNFCRMFWALSGKTSCSIGNLGGVCSDGTVVWERDPVLSVPETVALHRIFNTLAGRDINYVAMEATSHALYDCRLHGTPANIGAFTNLTRDHLDFHGTMEEYFRVKMTLFTDVLRPGSHAVLNADTPWFESAASLCKKAGHNIVGYGLAGREIRLLGSKKTKNGQELKLEIFGKEYSSTLKLFGEFQVSNVLCSLSIVLASGLPVAQAVEKIELLGEVEGRLNIVAVTPGGGKIVVDYAHTPDGLRAALEACRTFTQGELVVVFGCNGERDSGKRKEMGEIAASLADLVVVTDGHPRNEDPAKIRSEILSGAPGAHEKGDRFSAIEYAVTRIKMGGTALIAGMGHETFQVVGNERRPYSDRASVVSITAKLS